MELKSCHFHQMNAIWYNDFRKHFKNNIGFIRANILRLDYFSSNWLLFSKQTQCCCTAGQNEPHHLDHQNNHRKIGAQSGGSQTRFKRGGGVCSPMSILSTFMRKKCQHIVKGVRKDQNLVNVLIEQPQRWRQFWHPIYDTKPCWKYEDLSSN